MNRPSLERFCPTQRSGGFVVVNTSLITVRPDRKDVVLVEVPANQIAIDAGTGKAANMVMLGAYVGATGIVPFDAVVAMTRHEFAKKAKLIPVNIKCLEEGFRLGQAGRG
jgi:2-oxoglutarate ferredoxin oxidoreductase subunit gamma